MATRMYFYHRIRRDLAAQYRCILADVPGNANLGYRGKAPLERLNAHVK